MLNHLKAHFRLPDHDHESTRAWLATGPPPRQIVRWTEEQVIPELLNEVRPESLDVATVRRIARHPGLGARLASNPSLSSDQEQALESALFGHIQGHFEMIDPDQGADEPPHPDTLLAAEGLTQLYHGGHRPSAKVRRKLLAMVDHGIYDFGDYGSIKTIDHPAREAAFRALNSMQDLRDREIATLAAAANGNEDRLAAMVGQPWATPELWAFVAQTSYTRAVQERLIAHPEARQVEKVWETLKTSSHSAVLEVVVQITEGEERRAVFQRMVRWNKAEALELIEKDRWGLRADIEPADLEPLLNSDNKKYRLRAIQAISLLKQENRLEATGEVPVTTPEEPGEPKRPAR